MATSGRSGDAFLFLLLTFFLKDAFCGVLPCNSTMYVLFHCDDGTCINMDDFCDGESVCPDKSDEKTHPDLGTEASGSIPDLDKCQYNRDDPYDKKCILPSSHHCDHEVDCVHGQDECGCNHTFDCKNGDCVVKIQFCNGREDCADGSDETPYNRMEKIGFQCPVRTTHRTKVCTLPDEYVCDGDSDCDNGIDECFCDFTPGMKKGRYITDSYSNDKCFRCLDGSLIIPNNRVCDGFVHCDDLSDECLCPNAATNVTQNVCPHVCSGNDCACPGNLQCDFNGTVSCLNSSSICDSHFDCTNRIDEDYCAVEPNMFECLDGKKKIPDYQLCNGPWDCEDHSDETNCHNLTGFYCYRYRFFFPHVTDWDNVTEGAADIPDAHRNYIDFDAPHHARRCDGVPTCYNFEDECAAGCSEKASFCGFLQEEDGTPGAGAFRCPVSESLIIGKEICDGKPTCNDTTPEISEDEYNCPGRFQCKNKGKTRLPIHIPNTSRCDEIADCDDQSDEMGCPNVSHYYCNDGGAIAFVPRVKVCNGKKDCREGSDECQECTQSAFSDDEKLISSRVLVVFLWIIALIAVIGNFAVFLHQLRNLIWPIGTPNKITTCNRILVLNLSLADLFVGIYLLALGVKDANVSQYCQVDQEWRSSGTCSSLGSLALLGTEASVFHLLIMTSYRLYLVARPYKEQRTRVAKGSIVLAWALAALLAFLPHEKTLKDYFVSGIWYRNNRFMGYASRAQVSEFVHNLTILEPQGGKFSRAVSGGYTWDNMINAIKLLNESYVPERYFGYYSAHSVCLPRLFPEKGDISWGYSLFLVLLNFFAFVFILASYSYIYYVTTKTVRAAQSVSSEDRTFALQRKISRIVATDFCCWMPICIMAFVKVSGVYISDDAYAVTAIILMPINAAMNPFLYSSILDFAWERMLPLRQWCSATVCGQMVEREIERRKTRRATATRSEASETRNTALMTKPETDQSNSAEIMDETAI